MHILTLALHFWWVLPLLLALAAWKLVARIFGVVIVPSDKIGVVTKKFTLVGARLPDGHIVALKGEAGVQADTLAPGMHLWLFPWQYKVELEDFITIPERKVGVVEARDGAPIGSGRVFAKKTDCDSYQDARGFFGGGGQRGPQIEIIRPGVYRINPYVFQVQVADALTVPQDKVGLVTTNDGATLPSGDIAGPIVDGHASFQDGEAFIKAGGYKGRQEQVLLAGTYYLNPRFVNALDGDLTQVPIGYVGVVVSYTGVVPMPKKTAAVKS